MKYFKIFQIFEDDLPKSFIFITFEVPEQILNNMIYEVYMEDLDRPPKNRLRKIVFKDGTGLSTSEKLSIVGKISTPLTNSSIILLL